MSYATREVRILDSLQRAVATGERIEAGHSRRSEPAHALYRFMGDATREIARLEVDVRKGFIALDEQQQARLAAVVGHQQVVNRWVEVIVRECKRDVGAGAFALEQAASWKAEIDGFELPE